MTFRAFAIGFILLVLLTLASSHNGSNVITGATQFPMIVVFLLIVFSAVINPILRRRKSDRIFTQAEMAVIWCMLAAGLTVPSCGVMRYLLPMLVAPFYFAAEGSTWPGAFYQHIPDWLVPSKDINSPIVMMFYEGAGDDPVPLKMLAPWVVPFFCWGIMLMAAFLLMFCIAAIIRKQWVEYERLSFPLARIPMEITAPPEEGRFLNALFRSKLMWMGAAIPIFFWGLHIINGFLPSFPVINQVNWQLWGVFAGIFGAGWQGWSTIIFLAVGITFLLPTDVSLSLWLFYVLGTVQRSIRISWGYAGDGGNFDFQQQLGGYFAFAAVALWTMRHHLKDVFRKAFLGAKDIDDSREGMSYRFAVFGGILAVAVIVGWFMAIGCNPLVALVVVGISCVAFLVLARFVAQCGLYHSAFRPEPLSIAQDLVGNVNMGPKGLTAATFFQASLLADQREVLMPAVINNTKVAENKLDLRKIFAAMMLAVVVSYSISFFAQVYGYYKAGAPGESSYHAVSIPRGYSERLASSVTEDTGALNIGRRGVQHILVGAGTFALVHCLRARFYWWPVHPVGLLMIRTWPMQYGWISVFIGWLCKVLAQKYARGRMMATVRHFFLGLIIGEVLMSTLQTVIGFIV
ncbi:MAG: hypothetical protein HQ592_06555 [Planctomycetes bacterium]|nr:hypothetical protein [Planctomycetota bacterium]